MMQSLKPIRLFFRVLLVSVIVLSGIVYFERPIIDWLIPLLSWEITHLNDSFSILFFGIEDHLGASNIALNVVFKNDIIVSQSSHVVATNFYGAAGLLAQNVLHPLMVVMIAVLAWPGEKWLVYLVRLCVALPLTLLVVMIDSPIQLLASILTTFSKQIDSPWVTPTSMIYWSDFLNGGGLFAISLVCSLIAIRIGSLVSR